MPAPDTEVILEMARTIRPYLRELVENPDGVDNELATALAENDSGRAYAELRKWPKARRWTADFLEHGVPPDLVPSTARSGAAPPGYGEVVQAPRFRCPKGNDYVWYRRTARSPIPLCPTHCVRLAPDLPT